jgi:GNAT superfamily N-acetyltransferase
MKAGKLNKKHPEVPSISIRRAAPKDAEVCGLICFDAFRSISSAHGFPPDFPAPEVTVGVLNSLFSNPGFYCVVAESAGRIVGSNCIDERNSIAGIGPVTVDPSAQNHSAGRQLMQAVLGRAVEKKFAGTRLVQAAFHNRSLSLYAKLGFVVRE